MLNKNEESKAFFKSLFNVVGPIAIQNLISAAVSSADVVMLGFVGQTSIAAVSLASNVMFILIMIATGLSSGLVMLAAQYWGKKDYESIRTLHGIALRICSLFGLIFTLAAFFAPEFLMKIFTSDQPLLETGSAYLRAMSLSYLCFAVSQIFQAGFKSIERVKIVTVITVTALSLNIALNAVFIFGLFGAPKLGAAGVGLATSISRFIELIFCVIYGYMQKDVKLRFSNLLRFKKVLTGDFFRYSLPALGNELVWGAGFATYSVILGHMGEDIVAANSVVNVLRNLCTVLCFGMAYGGAVVLGKSMGAGDMELAERNAKRLIKSTSVAGIAGAVLLLCLKPVLPLIADLSETAARYRDILLYINCFSVAAAAFNTVLICGIFRAGGDAKFGFFMDCVFMWGISVPLGLLAAFVFKLPPLWIYFILYLDEFEKMPVIVIRYFQKKWLRNITRDL
ncbi:MAG: MATE family efflux transporter [Treponema sp.]|nr:MATE family efflux transporter [Treponema sp.]